MVARLDVRLDPVQAQVGERVAQHELDALAHVALAGERLADRVAEVRALQQPAGDLGEVEEAEDRVVLEPADEHRLEVGAARVGEVGGEPLLVGRARSPTAGGTSGWPASAR